MKENGLSLKLLAAFIAASAVLGATSAFSCEFSDRAWESFYLSSETRAAEISSASETARKLRSADAELLSAFAVRDTAAAEEYIFSARELLDGIEAGCADNKYLSTSESIRAVAEASEALDSISELIAEGDLPRAGRIYFTEYQPKLRTAAEYAERVSLKLSSENNDARRLADIHSDSRRLIKGIALLGISIILFFGLYIDVCLRKAPKPVTEEESPQNDKYENDKYETENEYDGIQFLTDKLTVSEDIVRTLVDSINTLADGDPDAAADGIYPDEYSEALSAVRKMKARLKFIGAQINRAAEFVSAEALRVSDNAEELSAAAEEQSSAADVLSKCSENMAGLISRSSEISERIKNDGGECRSAAEDCSRKLLEADGSMAALKESLEELNALAEAAADIASKANLLAVSTAMNVSKGELSGASLAASADEARSLAIRSEELSSEAGRIMESCGSSYSSAAQVMENAGSSVRELESSIGGIIAAAEEMSALNGEQTRAVAAVGDDIAKITGFVHLSKNAYEEYAASGRMLTEQTAALKKIMPPKQES